MSRAEDVVATELMGDVWPMTQPGTDPVLYGHVTLEPRGAFEARSLQTFNGNLGIGRHGRDGEFVDCGRWQNFLSFVE